MAENFYAELFRLYRFRPMLRACTDHRGALRGQPRKPVRDFSTLGHEGDAEFRAAAARAQ